MGRPAAGAARCPRDGYSEHGEGETERCPGLADNHRTGGDADVWAVHVDVAATHVHRGADCVGQGSAEPNWVENTTRASAVVHAKKVWTKARVSAAVRFSVRVENALMSANSTAASIWRPLIVTGPSNPSFTTPSMWFWFEARKSSREW